MKALVWLKALYADVETNDNWLEESLANDADIFAGLVKQPETISESSNTEMSTQERVQTDRECVIDVPTGTNNLIVSNDDTMAASNSLQALAREMADTVT